VIDAIRFPPISSGLGRWSSVGIGSGPKNSRLGQAIEFCHVDVNGPKFWALCTNQSNRWRCSKRQPNNLTRTVTQKLFGGFASPHMCRFDPHNRSNAEAPCDTPIIEVCFRPIPADPPAILVLGPLLGDEVRVRRPRSVWSTCSRSELALIHGSRACCARDTSSSFPCLICPHTTDT
jgi:hypothetical protein